MNPICATVTEITQIGTLTLATVSSTVALLGFIRTRRQEFENHLYKSKLDAFSNLIFFIDNFFNFISMTLIKWEDIEKEETKVKELSLLIDEEIFKCHAMVVKYSVYFSDPTKKQILLFASEMLGDLDSEVSSDQLPEVVRDYYKKQISAAEDIINSINDELGLTTVHSTLRERLQ